MALLLAMAITIRIQIEWQVPLVVFNDRLLLLLRLCGDPPGGSFQSVTALW